MGNKLNAELSGEALRRGLAKRQPAPGLIFHSDRGSEFAAARLRKLLAASGAEPELFSFVEASYNSTRLHSYNDYRSPNEAEADWRGKKKAA